MPDIVKNKKYYKDIHNELKSQYTSDGWDDVHREKTEYLYPHGRNLDDERKGSDGNRKDEFILNNTTLLAINVATSGLFSGITPPTEPWFRLADEDKEINERAEVREFYQKTTDLILLDMSKSNFYTIMELVYRDLLTYSISNMNVDMDFDRIFNFVHVPNGQYYIDVDGRGEVNRITREFKKRARNVISTYGEENVSARVRTKMSGNKTGGDYVTLLHIIERNEDRDITREDNQNMEWSSITYEFDGNDNDQKPLRKSGFRTQSFAVPRWSVSSDNLYGNGPGDTALGDAKQLQTLMELLLEAIEKDVNPPVVAPEGQTVHTGPNELTEYDNTLSGGKIGIEPLYRVQTDISRLVALIIDTQERIKRAYFADLFFAQELADPRETATKTIARQKELLRQLGPVTQRMTPEILQPIIHRCLDIEFQLNRLPDIPPILEGRITKVEIISSLTKAQELSIITPIEQIMTTMGGMAQIWPESTMKLDPFAAIDKLAETLGIPAGLIKSDEVIEQLMALQAQQELEARQAIQTQQAVDTAKQLSETDMSKDNALNAIVQQGAGA